MTEQEENCLDKFKEAIAAIQFTPEIEVVVAMLVEVAGQMHLLPKIFNMLFKILQNQTRDHNLIQDNAAITAVRNFNIYKYI